VFDRERVFRAGRFEKFLKMILRPPRLALEVTLGSRDILLTRVIGFLIIAVVAGSDCNASGMPLLPLFTIISTFPNALVGGFGWCCLAAVGGCFQVAQNEGSPNRLLARGVLSGDIKQLFSGTQLITTKIMHQCGARRAGPEHQDDIGVSHL
jgi:hypothetical protein